MGNIGPIVGLAIIIGLYFQFSTVSFDPKAIAGKRVLITGASSGIGEQLAYQYSKLGARVFITARRENLLENVAKKCKELGAEQVEFVTSDLGKSQDRDTVVTEVRKRLGGLDILLLNHAIVNFGIWKGSKENMTSLIKDMNVNFLSFVDLASQSLDMLTESKGSIGVVSSVAGKIAMATAASYATDKHAMQGFFSALRQELHFRNTGVSVTTCVIGPVDTDIVKMTEEEKKAMEENMFMGFDLKETAERTAIAIITGVAAREYEIYFGRIAWVMVAVHKFFPSFVEDFLGSSTMKNL